MPNFSRLFLIICGLVLMPQRLQDKVTSETLLISRITTKEIINIAPHSLVNVLKPIHDSR